MRAAFGKDGPAWTADNIHRIYTRVAPGFIRVDADEVTYPLHIMLRYRLERAMLAGDLALADLPGAWNDGMQRAAGHRAARRRGGLPAGHPLAGRRLGLFPDLHAGRAGGGPALRRGPQGRCPACMEAIGKGDFAPLLGWLRANVHGKGSIADTDEILSRGHRGAARHGRLQGASGKPLPLGVRGSHARPPPQLRMLRQGPAERRARRADLHLRVHVLCGLRPNPAGRPVPQLRRRSGEASDPPGADAGEASRLDQAGPQGSRSLPPGAPRLPSRSSIVRYISTRHGSQGEPAPLGFEDVMLAGLARDGGLYLPAEWPQFSTAEIAALKGKPYGEVAFRVMRPFVGDAFDEATFRRLIGEAYASFETPDVAPLKPLGDSGLHLLELFHGPTLAFKDVALQLLGRMLDHTLRASAASTPPSSARPRATPARPPSRRCATARPSTSSCCIRAAG